MVHLNESDVVVSHTISLPHASKLILALRESTGDKDAYSLAVQHSFLLDFILPFYFLDVILALTKKKSPNFRQRPSFHHSSNNHSSPPQNNESSNIGIGSNKVSSATEVNRKSVADFLDIRIANPNPIQTVPSNGAISGGILPTAPSRLINPSEVPAAIESSIPLALDIASDGNKRFLDAIRTFSQQVSNHIQAIINSAILFCHEEKLRERAARITKARSTESHLKEKATTKRRKKSVRILGSSLDSLSLSRKPTISASSKVDGPPFQRPPSAPKNISITKSNTKSTDVRVDFTSISEKKEQQVRKLFNDHVICAEVLSYNECPIFVCSKL